ncbi:hypothetical protein F5887DRAFT_881885, partial [Amanita rubescens]
FPPNTRGFLYYHTPPKAPPFVGELRFRCANSLEDFPNGKDLLSTDRFNPWSIPLSTLATQITYLNFRGQLILDGLTSQTTLDTWVTKSHMVSDRDVPSCITFASPFSSVSTIVDLSSTQQQKIKLVFVIISLGSGVVQLERYVCPRRPEKELVVFRVLKIVEPVKDLIKNYDGYIQRPTEGALIQRRDSIPAMILKEDAAILPHNFEDIP